MPAGQPTKYKPEYCQGIIDFFTVEPTKIVTKQVFSKKLGEYVAMEEEVPNKMPSFLDYSIKIGVDTTTLIEWTKNFPEFSLAYKKAKELQEEFWKTNSLNGHYNPAFTIFMGKNVFGWRDKVEIEGEVKHTLSLASLYDQALLARQNDQSVIEGHTVEQNQEMLSLAKNEEITEKDIVT